MGISQATVNARYVVSFLHLYVLPTLCDHEQMFGDHYRLGCDAVQSGRKVLVFVPNLLSRPFGKRKL
jgi:hypothetical protein